MQFDTEKYELIEHTYIEELRSDGYFMKHKASGARIVLLSNDDENKVFSIGFRTPPKDSTGVPHILEHSVLCGSDKYPVKDPFIELAKGSLNTFLNAMTYPDKTVYPVASCNDVDFKNLTDVYLDAVFHPLIGSRREVFYQEGWHYELENADAPLKYNGVVYNEMKGAYSSPDDVLSRVCMNSLFPDNSYSTESGGDPENIPELSYEEFVAFHKKLYHPSNSYIYFYGNCDMSERLEYLDREYLSKYDRIFVDSEIETQKPFDKMRRIEAEYSVTEEEGTDEKTYFAYNVAIGTSLDKELCMAFDILDYTLLTVPGAPVKQALLDAGLGEEIYGVFESGVKQPFYSIVAKNVDESREQEFLDIIRKTLENIVKNGIKKQTLEAAINSDEFKHREADFGRFPKGLMYGLNLLDTWLYDETKPFDRLMLNETYKSLKEKINTRFFEELIEKYILNNTHSSLVVMKPVTDLTEKKERAVEKKLADYKASLSKEEIEQIVEQTKALKKYQSEPTPDEELKKIPLLERKDISRDIIPLYNEEKEIDGVKVIHHDIYTNGIRYISICFNTDSVPDEYIPYVGLLNTLYGYVSTEKYSYEDLSDVIDINTGGIFTDYQGYKDTKSEAYKNFFTIKAKALSDKFDVVYSLMEEMTFHSKYDEFKRIREILAETKSRLQSKMISAGHLSAIGVCVSQMTEEGYIAERTSGIAYYRFIADLYDNFETKKEQIADILNELTKMIFTKEKMIISFVGDDKEYEANAPELAKFIAVIPDTKQEIVKRNFELKKVKIGYKTASQVNYVARCGSFKKAGIKYNPALNVLKTILSYDYLWNNVRVLGGAYGCMSGFSINGNGYFVSYRDPNVKETNEVYENIVKYIREFNASEREMTKYVIGTFSEIDTPLSAASKGARSFTAYIKNQTEEEIRKDRIAMLEVKSSDINALADTIDAILKDGYMCAIGSSEKIEADKDIFDEIQTLS